MLILYVIKKEIFKIAIVGFITLLYCAVSFSLSLGFLVEKIQQKQFKNWLFINHADLITQTYKINKTKLFVNNDIMTWQDENQEIIINGRLFDIVKINKNKDEVILTLFADELEEERLNNLASLFDEDYPLNKKKLQQMVKLVLSLQFQELNHQKINFKKQFAYFKQMLSKKQLFSEVFIGTTTPPPKSRIA